MKNKNKNDLPPTERKSPVGGFSGSGLAAPIQSWQNKSKGGRSFFGRRGQATTEVVLLFPIFMFFLFAFAKVYALLILVQKMEIASYYAARRWQLESHRNVDYEGDDSSVLQRDIQTRVSKYLGYDSPAASFLDLQDKQAQLNISRTQVWQVVTLKVRTKPVNMPFYRTGKGAGADDGGDPNKKSSRATGYELEVTKYVPNRDRPIAFVLQGLKDPPKD